MKSRIATIVLHVVGWVIFITLPMVMLSPPPRHEPFDMDGMLLFAQLSAIPFIALFYPHLYLLLPKLYLKKRYVWYALSTLVGAAATFFINRTLFFALVTDLRHHGPPPDGMLLTGTAIRCVIVLIVSFVLFIYGRWQLSEAAKAQAELYYLKAQINPHFLFNTLNSIYYLTLQKSDAAPFAVEKLSAIMRYVIDDGDQDRVSLEREVAYLRDYIALQKLRFADNVTIDLQMTGDLIGKQVAPLLMVSFVENAFKHGISMEAPSPITIILAVSSDHLRFTVRNRKFGNLAPSPHSPRIGLDNTQRRLALAYPDRHRLDVVEEGGEYQISLEIVLA